jgi:hypothetical protein
MIGSAAPFEVTYSNTYKLVHNKILDEYYVLYCTRNAPDLGNTFQSKSFIQIPVKSFAAIDTRAVGYLDVSCLKLLFFFFFLGVFITLYYNSFLNKVIILRLLEMSPITPHLAQPVHHPTLVQKWIVLDMILLFILLL